MIEYLKNVFALCGETYSYLFRVDADGFPEQLYFGAPGPTLADAEYLAAKPFLDFGASVNYDEKRLSLESRPLEWSGSGRGDYRVSPLELEEGGTDFRYASHRCLRTTVPMRSTLPQAHGEAETLELRLRDEAKGLELFLYYTVFPTALCRRTVLLNVSERPVVFTKLMSSSLDLTGSYEMITLNGGWIAEARASKVPADGAMLVNASVTGFSSNRHNPGFLLCEPGATERDGRVYGFNLIYSGNHYSAVQKTLRGYTRVVQGINPDRFRKELKPGESFETPEAVLCCSEEGFGGLSHAMHRFVNRHIVPAAWQEKERPVLFNSWEGCGMDFTEAKLLSLARKGKKLGCELFVLDDGWFGARNDDHAGLGDYDVNRRKLPSGMDGLARKIRALGLDFGLWFEPEAVNPDSKLYRAHPDWALREEGRADVLGRHELLLDLTRPEVRDYIVESVGGILDSAEISYVKWDMNRHSSAYGLEAHEYILGLCEVLRRIFGPRPQILLESCSSGGNRFDLGMMCFSPQVWTSDDTDPVERMTVQENLSLLYPQSVMGAHVSQAPHAQTLRRTPLHTRGNVSFFGILGYELDLGELLPVEEKEIRAQIDFYKANRDLFQFGEFRRVRSTDGRAWEVLRSGRAALGLFYEQTPASPGLEELRPEGLDRAKTYQVKSREQFIRVGSFGALISYALPVHLKANGAGMRALDANYPLKDGSEQYSASGAALMGALRPAQRFCGSGYDPKLRLQTDFGSSVYLIEPKE